MFKITGEAYGGLLEVAEETKDKSHLSYAKLKVKGFDSGLMHPVIELPCEGERLCLGVFLITGPEGRQRGYCTAGVTTWAVLLTGSERIKVGAALTNDVFNKTYASATSRGTKKWSLIGERPAIRKNKLPISTESSSSQDKFTTDVLQVHSSSGTCKVHHDLLDQSGHTPLGDDPKAEKNVSRAAEAKVLVTRLANSDKHGSRKADKLTDEAQFFF